jgi:hypothetical protein
MLESAYSALEDRLTIHLSSTNTEMLTPLPFPSPRASF